MRQIPVLLVLATAMVSGIPASSAAATSDARHARAAAAAEREGRFADAYVQLTRLASAGQAQKTHRAHLRAALQAQAAADALTRRHDDAGAKAVLDAARAKLDPVADLYVSEALADDASAAATRVAATQAAARAGADEQARATIAKGDAYGAEERWDDAAATYKSVAALAADAIDPGLRQRAAAKQLRAERRAIEDEPDSTDAFWRSIGDILVGVLKWLVILTGAAVLLYLLARGRGWWVARPLKGKTRITLADAGAEAKDRLAADRALGAELADAVQDVHYASLGTGGSEVDEHRDLDGAATTVVHLGSGTEEVETFGDIDVKVGTVTVRPLQVWWYLRSWLARPGARNLVGTLRSTGGGVELSVKLTAGDGVLEHWTATGSGDTGRADVVRQIAQRFVARQEDTYVSADWRSIAAYRDGLAALTAAFATTPAERGDCFERARAAFERALSHDATNLLARIRMGSTLRALGRNAEAAAQFARLMEDTLAPETLPVGARKFVDNHPDLYYMAYINRSTSLAKWSIRRRFEMTTELAMVLARIGNDPLPPVVRASDRARLLEDLAGRTWPALPAEDDRRRLQVQALAAWASSLIFTVDVRDAGPPASVKRLRDRRDEVLGRLAAARGELDGAAGSSKDALGVLGSAQALIDNAIARVQFRQQRLDLSRDAAEAALVLSPDLGDAHIVLADIAVRPPQEGEWSTEAERHLLRALEISPKDSRARYKLGRFYQSIGDDAKAKAAFAELVTDWRALDRLGEIHLENAEIPEAIRCFVRSQGRHETSDYRAERLVKAVLDWAKVPGARLLDRDTDPTLRAGQRVIDDATDAPRKKVAVDRMEQLRTAVALLTRPPDKPEPPLPGPD